MEATRCEKSVVRAGRERAREEENTSGRSDYGGRRKEIREVVPGWATGEPNGLETGVGNAGTAQWRCDWVFAPGAVDLASVIGTSNPLDAGLGG